MKEMNKEEMEKVTGGADENGQPARDTRREYEAAWGTLLMDFKGYSDKRNQWYSEWEQTGFADSAIAFLMGKSK